jgi:hypothetical protein
MVQFTRKLTAEKNGRSQRAASFGISQALFRLFGFVFVLWQFDEKKPKTRRLRMGLVDGYDAELVGSACAEFVTAGGNFMVRYGQPSVLLFRAGESAPRNG